MANTLSVMKVNILAGALDVLSEEMALAKIINAGNPVAEYTAKKGDVISWSNPAVQTVDDVVPAATPPAITDTVVVDTQVTLDKWKRTRFTLTDQEAAALLNPSTFVNMQVASGVRGLAKQVNSDLWTATNSIYGYVGTAGTSPFSSNVNSIADARKTLNDQLCPMGNRYAIFSHATEAAALKLGTFNTAYSRGSDVSLNKGELGDLYGFHCMTDSQVPTHTAGTITTGLIAKASTVQAAGVTTVTCTTAASTGACALLVGDIITFSGDSQTYTVTANATQASASTDVSVAISPAKVVALAGSETVAVKATHEVNIGFDPQAFALPLRAPATAFPGTKQEDEGMVMVDPKSGIPLRLDLIKGYHCYQIELSLLYGVKCIDPRRACRIAG